MKTRQFLRRISLLLCVALILGVVPVNVMPAPVIANAATTVSNGLIPNSNFDSSEFLTHWSLNGTGKAELQTGIGGNKTNALMIEDLSASTAMEVLSSKFPVEQSDTYRFSIDVFEDGELAGIANGHLAVYIFWYDEVGNYIDSENYYAFLRATGDIDAWKTITQNVSVPVGTAQASVRFNFFLNNVNRVWVDNLSLTKVSEGVLVPIDPVVPTIPSVPNDLPVATIPTESTAATEATSATEPVQTLPIDSVEPMDFPANRDFENVLSNGKPSGWNASVGAGSSMSVIDSDVYSGSKAVKFTGGSGVVFLASARHAVTEGKYYTLTGVSKRLSGAKNGYIGLWFYNASGKCIDAVTAPLGQYTQWTESFISYAAPAGAVTMLVELGYNSNGNSSCLVDCVELRESDLMLEPSPDAPQAPAEPVDYNFSFEKLDANGNALNWTVSNGISVQKVDDAPDGNNVIQISGIGKGTMTKTIQMPVKKGQSYKLTVMARDISGSKGIIGLYMVDKNGTYTNGCGSVSTGGVGKWKAYSVIATATEDTVSMHIELWSSSSADVIFQVDAITLEETNEVPEKPWEPSPYEPVDVENINDGHPYLYLNTEELALLKSYKNDTSINAYGFSWRSQVENLIYTAESYLQETTVKVRSNYGTSVTFQLYPVLIDPNDPGYDEMYIAASKDPNGDLVEIPHLGFGSSLPDAIRVRLETLSLAYALTGDTRYSELAIRYTIEMCGWKYWGDWDWLDGYTNGAHKADASVAWALQGVVAVYDLCTDQLSDAQKRYIENAIIEKGLIPMSQEVNLTSIQNGNCMLIGGMLSGIAAILTDDNAQMLKPVTDLALTALHNAFAQFAESGNTEGHYYAGFGLEYLLPGAMHFYRATGLQWIVEHPLLTELLPYWTVMFAAPGSMTHPNYSDAGTAVQLIFPMAVISKMTDDPLANYFLAEVGGIGTAFDNLIYLDPDPKMEPPKDSAAVVDPIGYGALRTGFADDDMLLTLLANDSQMGHNHYHQNAIHFNFAGKWLIGDPGVGSYYYANRYFWTHAGHSTILVDDSAQSVMGTGSMEMVFSEELYSYIIGSAPDAYGSDFEGDVLEKFDRHAIQIDHGESAYYIVIDDLLSENEHTYTWQMYNEAFKEFVVDGKLVTDLDVVKGNSVSMEYGENTLSLYFVDGEPLDIARKDHTGGNYTFTATSEATKAHQFMTVISANKTGDDSVGVSDVYETDLALAARIAYAEGCFDLIAWNRTDSGVSVAELFTDAKQASILGLANDRITEGFAATSATSLAYRDIVLFEAEKEVDIVASAEGWKIVSSEAQEVSLAVEKNKGYLVCVNGEETDTKAKDGVLTITVAAGETHVTVTEVELEVYDPNGKFLSTGLSLGTFIGLQNLLNPAKLNGGVYDEVYFLYNQFTTDENGTLIQIGSVRGEFVPYGSYLVADIPVNAKQMSDVYEIVPYYVVDGVTYYGATTTTSVKAEAMKKINAAKTDEKTKALCVAMLNYGAEAQKNFEYSTADLANALLSAAQKTLPAFKDLDLVKVNNIPAGTGRPAQAGLSLGDVVYMQFLVSKSKVDANGTLKYQIPGGDPVVIPMPQLETYSSYYLINIPIKAKDVRSDITVAFCNANGVSIYSMTCSIEAFATGKEGSSTETLTCALMAYGDAAKAVFG